MLAYSRVHAYPLESIGCDSQQRPGNDRGSWTGIRATAQQLRKVACAAEPGVLETLQAEEHPDRLRSIALDLLDCTLHFLNQVVWICGVSGRKKRRYNQTFEAALRRAVRQRVSLGDLAKFAHVELCGQRAKLQSSSLSRSVLILECANAISAVRVTAVALDTVASRAGQPTARRSPRTSARAAARP
jgi:hypothetical protein